MTQASAFNGLNTLDALKAHFQRSDLSSASLQAKTAHKEAEYRQAAVLILIYPGAEELELILTKRSEDLPHHAGQISLPGGTVETDDDSHIHTALREANEEIGLNHQHVDILGSLERVLLPSGFAVTPVIGTMERSQALQADPREVEKIFSIPLKMVLDTQLYKRDSYSRNGINREFYFFDYKEYYVWGATAGILHSLALELEPLSQT